MGGDWHHTLHERRSMPRPAHAVSCGLTQARLLAGSGETPTWERRRMLLMRRSSRWLATRASSAEQHPIIGSIGTATSYLSSSLGFDLDGRGDRGDEGFAGAFLAELRGVFPPPV
jgi:hypothetical protein